MGTRNITGERNNFFLLKILFIYLGEKRVKKLTEFIGKSKFEGKVRAQVERVIKN